MKYPVLYAPTLAAQESLVRAVYALEPKYTYNLLKTADQGWKKWVEAYVQGGKPIYLWLYLTTDRIYPSAAKSFANFSTSFVLTNSERQLIAYVKACAKVADDEPTF